MAQPHLKDSPAAQELIHHCQVFLNQIQNLTPGPDLEHHLNTTYDPTSNTYTTLSKLVRQGFNEGWLASIPIDGSRYRRSKLALPSAENYFFTIAAVYMDSEGKDKVYSGQSHGHPYGEINCVVPITDGAELAGIDVWTGPGWTAPGPGTHHVPQVRGGALVALYFLPAGRIAYDVDNRKV